MKDNNQETQTHCHLHRSAMVRLRTPQNYVHDARAQASGWVSVAHPIPSKPPAPTAGAPRYGTHRELACVRRAQVATDAARPWASHASHASLVTCARRLELNDAPARRRSNAGVPAHLCPSASALFCMHPPPPCQAGGRKFVTCLGNAKGLLDAACIWTITPPQVQRV